MFSWKNPIHVFALLLGALPVIALIAVGVVAILRAQGG